MEREFTMEEGKAGDEVILDSPDLKFGDKAIRRGFIRKVYMILSVQLSFTVASIIFFTFYIPRQYCTAQERDTLMTQFSSFFMSTAKEYNSTEEQEKNEQKLLLSLCARKFSADHQWILWISLILSIIVVIPMACVRTLRVSFPINFILLAIFTTTEGIILGMVSMKYDTDAVIIAAGITTIIVFSLTIFAFQTKVDFTMMGGMLLCVLVVFMLFGLVAIFLPQSRTLHMVGSSWGSHLLSLLGV